MSFKQTCIAKDNDFFTRIGYFVPDMIITLNIFKQNRTIMGLLKWLTNNIDYLLVLSTGERLLKLGLSAYKSIRIQVDFSKMSVKLVYISYTFERFRILYTKVVFLLNLIYYMPNLSPKGVPSYRLCTKGNRITTLSETIRACTIKL